MKYKSIPALTLFAALPALALSDVTWVASTGTNNVNCFRTTPCATFAQALLATNANGVIKTADAAEFGIVTITQNVTIDGNGSGATIDAGSGTGITINNNPGGQVTIRNLTIHVAAGGHGIDITGGGAHLENVLIMGAPFYGVNASSSSPNPVNVTIKNVTITNASQVGILIQGASGSLRDSVIRGASYGILVQSLTGLAAVALVERCELSYNSTGLFANNISGPGVTVRVSDTVITGNFNGILTANGGQIISFRTNMLAGNTTDGTTPFSISLK
jgi:hypothetical protein